MTWKEAIERPGAEQMMHVRTLMESRSMLDRVPDQELIVGNIEGQNYMVATRGERYAMIFSPNGLRFTAAMGRIAGEKVKASWFNPRNGEFTEIGEYDNQGEQSFHPPSSGRRDDWVLVLDSI